jgi:8-oxo-dGTP pyrophosphatase MutT (NUDIX family)
MRKSSAAFAWIERQTHDGPRFLTQWNRKWQAFNLVGGHVEPGESFRECVVREMIEELGIAAAEFDVSDEPLARIEFTTWSVPAQETTEYEMAAFRAALRTEAAASRIEANADNRWLSREELARGTTDAGQHVSEVSVRFFVAIVDGEPP